MASIWLALGNHFGRHSVADLLRRYTWARDQLTLPPSKATTTTTSG
jgi:hypothetical protein